MRDGNTSKAVCIIPNTGFSLPMRDGNLLYHLLGNISFCCFSLPMRDGNHKGKAILLFHRFRF